MSHWELQPPLSAGTDFKVSYEICLADAYVNANCDDKTTLEARASSHTKIRCVGACVFFIRKGKASLLDLSKQLRHHPAL